MREFGLLRPLRDLGLVQALQDVSAVSVENSSEARIVASPDGRWWVFKAMGVIGSEGMLAEGICWQLARALTLRVPDASHGELADHGLGWMSLYVHYASAYEGDEFGISNLEDVGSVLALDAIVCNEDRHADNLLLEVGGDSRFVVRPIDWDRAAVSRPKRFMDYGLAGALDVSAVIPELPLEKLRASAEVSAQNLSMILREEVEAIVRHANRHVGVSEAHAMECIDLLVARLAVAPRIVEQYWQRLSSRGVQE